MKATPHIPAMLALVMPLVTTGALADEPTGALYGTVAGPEAEPLPGVSVSLSGPGASRLQVTNDLGRFHFLGLDPGRYALEAIRDGFSTVEYPDLEIRAGRNTTLEVQLSKAVEDSITVSSTGPLLDERKLAQGSVVTRKELEILPTTRDPWALLDQVPGVLVDRIDLGGSRAQQSLFTAPGVDARQNDYLQDGIQITDMSGPGVTPTYFDFGQFAQIELATGGNDITKATAGVSINMVTKRGTNEFRGSGRLFVTDESLQSSPGVDRGDLPPGQQGIETSSLDSISEYGIDGGGPAVRERLWFWGSWAENHVEEITVGGERRNTTVESVGMKLNAQPSGANSLLASWTSNEKRVPNRNAGPQFAPSAYVNQRGPSDLLRLEDTHLFSSTFVLTGAYSSGDGGFTLVPTACIEAGSCEAAPEALLGPDFVWRNSSQGLLATRPQDELKLDGYWFPRTGGISHQLRFGARRRQVEDHGQRPLPGRRIAHLAGSLVGLPPGVGLFLATRGEDAPVELDYSSAWVQDTVSTGSWTVNLGLRYDAQGGDDLALSIPANPGVPEALPALDYPGGDGGGFTWRTLSPRLGVTYALGEERATLLRASFSRFAEALGVPQVRHTSPAREAIGTFLFFDLNGNLMWDGAPEPFQLADADGFDPFDPAALVSPNQTDPALDAPITDELVLSVEHAFRPEFVAGLSLTWRETTDVLEQRGLVRDAAGLVRAARREDYRFDATLPVTRPDGSLYPIDFYALSPGLFFTGGDLLINGDRTVGYLGAALTVTRRLTNRWMLRGYLNYGEAEWEVPASFFAFDDPTDVRAVQFEDFDNDGDLFAQPGGRVEGVFLQSTWAFNLNGMYQVAPDRPWGFNVAGNIYGREGYPRPYWAPFLGSDGVLREAQAVGKIDEFRYEDILTVDLRLEKELAPGGALGVVLSADVFNIFNEGYVLERNLIAGLPVSDFVLETLGPRVWRLGLRLSWG